MKYCILALLLATSVGLHAQTSKYHALMDSLDVLEKVSNFGKAITLLNRALNADSTCSELYNRRGYEYVALQDYTKAYDDYTTAIHFDSTDYSYYFSRAQMLAKQGLNQDALDDYRAALKLSAPDTIKAGLLVNMATIKIALGTGDPEGDFRSALILDSNSMSALPDLAMFLFEHHGYNEESVRLLKRAIRIDSNFQGGYGNLAFIYGESGQYQKALAMNEVMVRKYPKDPFALNNRGYDKIRLGDFEGALEDINNSLAIMPDNSYAFSNRALLFLAQKKTVDACRDLQKAKTLGFDKQYGNEVNNLLEKHCGSGSTHTTQSL